MDMTKSMQQILDILAGNVRNNPSPNLVATPQIAGQVGMSVQETKQLLRAMHVLGVVETSVEGDFTLITSSGMRSYQSVQWSVTWGHGRENIPDACTCLSF